MDHTIIQIRPKPGVRRDGTTFDADFYNDALWCRFQRGLPRKIGGFRSLSSQIAGVPRTMRSFTRSGVNYVHIGSSGGIEQVTIDGSGNASASIDRTPVGYVPNPLNVWKFDTITDPVAANKAQLVAHVAPNLSCICSADPGQIYIGDMTGTGPLTAIPPTHTSLNDQLTATTVAGGIAVLHPYLFSYGADGYMAWSVANTPQDFISTGSGDGWITEQKVITALQSRGGQGASPSGLFWSANALVRVSFTGGSTVFAFDTISDQITILSSSGVAEVDGMFFWVGVDRFYVYNGVVREMPNDMNQNWFFDNVNFSQRQKIFAFRDVRWGEIWWCFPFGNATECTHAIIYNYRENIWYDTELPNGGRSAADPPMVYPYPLMTGVDPDPSTGKYKLWQHNVGTDQVDGSTTTPVRSYFETCDFSFCGLEQNAIDKAMQCVAVEPDFVQAGDLTLTITGNANARAPVNDAPPITIPAVPDGPATEIALPKLTRRQMRFRFESNTPGGNYQMGKILAHVRPSDGTYL
jgi:hypothetical protein